MLDGIDSCFNYQAIQENNAKRAFHCATALKFDHRVAAKAQ